MSDPPLEALLTAHDAASPAQVLKQTPRHKVTRLPYDAQSACVAKEERHPGGLRRLHRALGGSRARRTQRAIGLLQARNLASPEWLGALEQPDRSVAFVRQVAGPTLGEALSRADRREARTLAAAAASLAAELHGGGLATRDLKPPNLIVSEAGALTLVDLDDLRPSRGPRYVWRNLAALDAYAQLGPRPLSVGARLSALQIYCQARQLEPAEVLRQVLPRSRAKRTRLRAQAGAR